DALVLQPVVAAVEISASARGRNAVLLVVPEPCQSLVNLFARRNATQKAECQFVLCFDPGARLGTVGILEPAIRIGHGAAVIVVDLVAAPCCGVNDWLGNRVVAQGRELLGGRCFGRTLHGEFRLLVGYYSLFLGFAALG